MNRTEAAPLSATLLARKGAARPTASPARLFAIPQPAQPPGASPAPSPARAPAPGPAPASAPVPAYTHDQGDGLPGDRRRITLRLDHKRHVRLKLAAAHLEASIQDIMTAALDAHLARVAPDIEGGFCACLAREGEPA